MNEKILKAIKSNNNLITTKQFIELGFSKSLLYKYVNAGLLVKERQGVYSLRDELVDDMYVCMLKSNNIIFSHDTALFLNNLSDRTLFVHSVTIPSNTKISPVLKEDVDCYYIKPELHSLGVIEKKTTFGNTVRCYNCERTICDMLRCRHKIDEETVLSAIKNYAQSNDKDLHLLYDYAKKFKVTKIVKGYLGLLL